MTSMALILETMIKLIILIVGNVIYKRSLSIYNKKSVVNINSVYTSASVLTSRKTSS